MEKRRHTPTRDTGSLHDVAAHGFVEELRTLIDQQADVNALDEDGFSPVFYAASQSRVPKILQTLVDAKADPNLGSRYATGTSPDVWAEILKQRRPSSTSGHNQLLSPLTWATLKKSAAKVKILIDAKADVNFINVDQDKSSTALFLAVEMGSPDIAKLLVEAKAALNVLNRDAYTVFDVAERNGQDEIVKLLLDAGAPHGVWWRMQQACIHGRAEEVKLLLDAGYPLHLQDTYSQMPLVLAVRHGRTDIAQTLIAARAQVNVCDDAHCPITYSIQRGDIELTKALIDARADVDLTPRLSHKTALCMAVERGNINAARLLIDAKADMNCSIGNRMSLASAAENGQLGMMQLLLESKAVIDAATGEPSPLLAAIQRQKLPAMRVLLEAKAGTDIPGTNLAKDLLSHALDIFMVSQNDEVLRLLLDANPSLALNRESTKLLGPLYKQKRFSTLQLLLEKRAHVNGATVNGVPILYQAVSDRMPQMVKLMIDAKANVNVRGRGTKTPLILACRRRYRDIVQMLLEVNAQLEYSALKAVIDGRQSTVLQMLVDAKANLRIRYGQGESLLMLALENNLPNMIDALLNAEPSPLHQCNGKGMTALMLAVINHRPHQSANMVKMLLEQVRMHFAMKYNDIPPPAQRF